MTHPGSSAPGAPYGGPAARPGRTSAVFTGISRHHVACLVEELARPWQAVVEGCRYGARGGARKRTAGAGPRHQLVFVDRLTATLIHLRHDLPHSVLGLLFGVDRSTTTRAIDEIRTLLAERGCAVPNRSGLRLRFLADAVVPPSGSTVPGP
ncbi:transposase family protein [Streptomyces sp. NBC_00378]|nr:transposase family protein [Streptomyces sp. NBC_00378]